MTEEEIKFVRELCNTLRIIPLTMPQRTGYERGRADMRDELLLAWNAELERICATYQREMIVRNQKKGEGEVITNGKSIE